MTIHVRHTYFNIQNIPVNCFYILVVLKQSTCYTVTQDIHQWYGINTNKIIANHTIATCNDSTINIVLLPPDDPSEFNAFETIVRLSLSQNQRDLPSDTQTQTTSNTPTITNNNIGNTSTINMKQPQDQSTIILQQFGIITEELKKIHKESV